MLNFIAAVYNEEAEVEDLIEHVAPYVHGIYFADDGSTDRTLDLIESFWDADIILYPEIHWKQLDHTGLPETVKNEALQLVPNGSWVLMLDADERFAPGVLDQIVDFVALEGSESFTGEPITHVYFTQLEVIDGVPVRQFQKSKLFRKEAVTFSKGIHEDDQFTGTGLYKAGWVVYHRKTSEKQKMREQEYLQTYQNLLLGGKIDMGRYDWLRNLHHYHKGNKLNDTST